MIVFLLGILWFFMISMQTRIIAFADNYYLHAGWTFSVSLVWVFLIKQIMLTSDYMDCILYALGTAVGSVAATCLHVKLHTKKDPTK